MAGLSNSTINAGKTQITKRKKSGLFL